MASGAASDDRRDGARHVVDASQEARLVEEAVVDRHIEAIAVGAEEPVQAWGDGHTGMFLSGLSNDERHYMYGRNSVFKKERKRRLCLSFGDLALAKSLHI